jgi:putative peptidoglycan lipid II flippase
MSQSSAFHKIKVASLIMMASIFLSRFMGLLREMTIAAVAGADAAVDAYRVAFILPEILNHILASGFLSVTFIPIFARYLAKDDEAGGFRIFSLIMTVFGVFLTLLILAAMMFTPQLVAILSPGRSDPVFQAHAVRMTRIILPAQFFFFAGGLLMAVQFAKEHFAIPALAPLLYNLGIIAGGLFLGPKLGMEGFAWGVLAGAFLGNFAIQWAGARRVGLRFSFCFDWLHPDLRRYVTLTLPLMLGLTMTFSTEIFSKFFGSFLPDGAISWIDYAMRIMLMLVAFFGQAVGVASYPFMARLAADGRMDELNRLLNGTLRYLALVLPVSVLVMVLREEVVVILYQRGHFSATDTAMTAAALGCLLTGAVAFAAQTVVNRGFYAVENTLFPAIFGSLAVILSLPVYWIGLNFWGVAGVGLAIALSALFQVAILYGLWNRRSHNTGSGAVYRFYAKIAAASLTLGLLLEGAHRLLIRVTGQGTLSAAALSIITTCALFLLLTFLSARLLGIEEIKILGHRILRRRQGSTDTPGHEPPKGD